jgi:hypothetical protein
MATQLNGGAGTASNPIEIGEDQYSYGIHGTWAGGTEVILQETEGDPNDLANPPTWYKVPASQMIQDGGFNMKTGFKWMRAYVNVGNFNGFFDLKRIRTDGSITK